MFYAFILALTGSIESLLKLDSPFHFCCMRVSILNIVVKYGIMLTTIYLQHGDSHDENHE